MDKHTPFMLYHWTHVENLRPIEHNGLDPDYAEGRKKCVWLCEYGKIGWALCHIATRHGWEADSMICLQVRMLWADVRRSANDGVYTCAELIHPNKLDAVLYRIGGGWIPYPRFSEIDTQ